MSALNSLFNRSLLGAKCKTCLNLAISRIKLLRNKREVQLVQMRKEISQFLQTGQEAISRIRVEHVVREQNTLAAYEIIELFCEFILARVPILDTQRACPTELQEAIASIIFAAPRCSDVPELVQIKNLFTAKYGKEFVSAASELRPDSGVNRVIIEKLSVRAPPVDVRLAVMKGIAQEYNLEWDSSNTEVEFSKSHEDLLDGLNPANAQAAAEQSSMSIPSPKAGGSVTSIKQNQRTQTPNDCTVEEVRSPILRNASTDTNQTKLTVSNQRQVPNGDDKISTDRSSSDVLERARAAIASAERACAAARTAAKLANIRVGCPTGSNNQCA